jgi:hypothetical protein
MDNIIEVVANRLKMARHNRGYASCRDFALKNGFCPRTYQRHEGGKNKIDFHTMTKYCEALQISIIWLQTGDKKYLDV